MAGHSFGRKFRNMAEIRGVSVILSLGVLLSSALGAPINVANPTPQITAKEGSSAELQCIYPGGLTNPRVEWKFVNNDQETSFVFYDGLLTASYKDRATAYHQGITLKSITRKDNGEYICEVASTDSSGTPLLGEAKTKLTVLVPPSVPVAQVPTSVTTGGVAVLTCIEKDGNPPSTFTWYKNKIPLPSTPSSNPAFQNSSYTLNPTSGVLTFDPVQKSDAGEYSCEAGNSQGKQISSEVTMGVGDVNVGGIVAAVVIVILLLILIAVAVWFAYSRGYICNKTNKKVIYSQPSETRSDRNFQQTSSFLV